MATIPIILNGERSEIPSGSSAADIPLLAGVGNQPVAIVVNGVVVHPLDRSSLILSEHDEVEVLVFAGGG
jgi:thiamine biosynthesis protein ThiS